MVYMACDINLFQEGNKERDDKIIESLNKLGEDDSILFCGQLINAAHAAHREKFKEILKNLKSKKILIDKKFQTKNMTEAEIEDLGWTESLSLTGFAAEEVNGELVMVYIPTSKKEFDSLKKVKEKIASYPSMCKIKKVYKNNILNIGIDAWNLEPIPYKNIPQLYVNMQTFEKMNDGESKEV